MKAYKELFSRALGSAPGRLHFAAHSHHLWPDAAYDGHMAAADAAMTAADHKWDAVFGDIIPKAQAEIAAELSLPDSQTITFAPNTHELLRRVFSARADRRPLRVLSSDGEFHSFSRQAARWAEAGVIALTTISVEPFLTFPARFAEAAATGAFDIAFVSQVMFQTGFRVDGLERIASACSPDGLWLIIDGYHAFMAMPVDLSALAGRAFYLGGGYKYAMAGEGACFLHAPPGFGPRPEDTGWFAAFAAIETGTSDVGYATSGARFLGATFDPSGLYRFTYVRAALASAGLSTPAISNWCNGLRAHFLSRLAAGHGGPLAAAARLEPNKDGPLARFVALRTPAASALAAALGDHGVVVDTRGDILRIGFGLYQSTNDVDAMLNVAARL